MNRVKKPRAQQVELWLTTNRQLIVIFRRFKTKKANRSAKTRQIVIPLRPLPLKEVVIKTRKRRYIRPLVKLPWALQPRNLVPLALIALGVGGIAYFGTNLTKPPDLQAVPFTLEAPSAQKKSQSTTGLVPSEPKRLIISSVGIDAEVGVVGQKADESMEVPENPHLTGWYRLGPTPGEIGPSIIVGHVDNYKIGPAVFWRLREVKAGDEISVLRADGKTVSFRVTGLEQYDQSNFPTQKVYGDIDYAGLRLITCSGTYNNATGHYTENTVVYAEMIPASSS